MKTAGGAMRYDWLPLAGELKTALLDWKERRPFKTEWVFGSVLETVSPNHNGGEPYKNKKHKLMPSLCKKAGAGRSASTPSGISTPAFFLMRAGN